jgi:hypothetical protein
MQTEISPYNATAYRERDGKMRYVNSNPIAVECLSGVNRRAAPTERIKNQIAFVGGCGDNSL